MTIFLSESILEEAYSYFVFLANSAKFWDVFSTSFGTNYDVTKVTTLHHQWQAQDFNNFPEIQVVGSDVLGSANGAYAASTNKIYISESFLASASDDAVVALLLEEYGHYVDAYINLTDSAGDEGRIFAALIMGESLSEEELQALKSEDDSQIISINGQNIAVEMANYILGSGNDNQTGTLFADYMDGNAGNDTLRGSDGNDTILGGTGEDKLFGGNHDDEIRGGSDNDTLNGDAGNDYLEGNDGHDYLNGQDGNDRLYGGFGDDLLGGENGNDYLSGNEGYDTLYGSFGEDELHGGSENDVLYGESGFDTLWGQDGNDTLIGGTENDFLAGENGNDSLYGEFGNDSLYGGEGNDFLAGQEDNDLVYGENGDDLIGGQDGFDTLIGGYGNDAIYGEAGNDSLYGEFGNDTLYGGEGNDFLAGQEDNDLVYGENGDDLIGGQDGFDTLIGGYGNDTIYGEAGNDHLFGHLNFSTQPVPGLGEIDVLDGGTGSDRYYIYKHYDDQNATTEGTGDYARIIGFNPNEDVIVLSGVASDFLLTISGTNTRLYINKPGSEPDELIAVIEGVTGLNLNSSTFDTQPTLTISDVTISEGNTGIKYANFTVTRTGTPNGTLTVNFGTANGTATAGNDYGGMSGTLTFATNETFKTIPVPIFGDTILENDETFFVNLSNLVYENPADFNVQGILNAQGLGTILNDDIAPLPTLSINDITINEGNNGNTATFTVTRGGTATQPITVTYTTANGTATAGSDYTAVSGTLTFATNETTKTITVPILSDTLVENNETFFVNLTNPTNATIADGQGMGTIIDYKGSFSPISGYGFVSASGAVAKAINQSPFPEVPTYGGTNDWNVNMVDAPEAWAKGYTGSGVVVAVLDTGVDRNHIDLSNNIWRNTNEVANDGIDNDNNGYVDDVYGWNFASQNNNTLDIHGHGTHVSGTIAGLKNSVGVTGIAHNAKIMPVKVLNDEGFGTWTGIAQGIRYAVDNGAKVINMSLGGPFPNTTVQQAVQYASDRGVIVVMAAGNESESQPAYPARYALEDGVAVGAVNFSNQLADFSNKAGSDSAMAYVTAPGVSIYSTLPGGQYASWKGTSMAAPHVAGVVALMLSANPNLTDAQVRNILTTTTQTNPDSTAFIPVDTSILESTVTIINDNLPTLSINDVTITEGNSGTVNATFTVTRTGVATQPITVNYATVDGSAAAGSDYTAVSGILTFATNETSKTITVSIPGDAIVEDNEIFYLHLNDVTNAIIANGQGLGTIVNNDFPTLSINDVTITEGNSGTTNATFTVTRSGTALSPITVNYATANNTATSGSDYTAVSGTLTFATNETTKTVTVPIIGDTTVEPDETFFANLTNPTNATLADGQGLGTITNDDSNTGSNYFLTTPGTWAQVQAQAQAAGGNLVTVNDAQEHQLLLATFGSSESFWIGFTDQAQEGVFNWISGEPVTFTNWVLQEPNNYNNEDYTAMNQHVAGGWADLNGTQLFRGIVEVNNSGLLIVGDANNNNLVGGAGNDTLRGLDGKDTLNGGLGADSLEGGNGNDTYYVDNSGDIILETTTGSTGGIDLLNASVSYTLPNLVENLTLTGSSAINGTGNSLANTITGNNANNYLIGDSGNDKLDGKGGIDTLDGGAGNDSYTLDNVNDVIIDSAGTDTVSASFTYTLANGLENLTLTGSAAINGTGNSLGNTITGNTGSNLLSGLDGNDNLNGGKGNDTLLGGNGNDTLIGSLGNDNLTGGMGNDFFRYNSGTEGIDIITDFSVVDDTILVSRSGFGGGLTAGVLDASQLLVGAGVTSATTSAQRFLYNTTTGALLFDGDGNGTSVTPTQFATLSSNLALTADDFTVF